MNKSYNPFKMWGSWTGILFYPVLTAVFWTGMSQSEWFPKWLEVILGAPMYPFARLGSFIIDLSKCIGEECWGLWILNIIISSLIPGFLIGWGIHGLIRKLRN